MNNNQNDWEDYAQDAIKVYPYILKDQTANEVDGIEKILNLNKNMKILDLCCAWGRHCIELASRGFQYIIGVDISETFLNKARDDAEKLAIKVDFLRKDMRNLQFQDEFDVVINMFTSFGFFEDEKENLKVLEEIFSSLHPTGRFLIDMINRESKIKKGDHKDWWYINGQNVVGLVEKNFDVKRGIASQKFAIFSEDKYREHSIKFRLYTVNELTNLLKLAGFDIYDIYGDFQMRKYTIDSPRLIIVAKKP